MEVSLRQPREHHISNHEKVQNLS